MDLLEILSSFLDICITNNIEKISKIVRQNCFIRDVRISTKIMFTLNNDFHHLKSCTILNFNSNKIFLSPKDFSLNNLSIVNIWVLTCIQFKSGFQLDFRRAGQTMYHYQIIIEILQYFSMINIFQIKMFRYLLKIVLFVRHKKHYSPTWAI